MSAPYPFNSYEDMAEKKRLSELMEKMRSEQAQNQLRNAQAERREHAFKHNINNNHLLYAVYMLHNKKLTDEFYKDAINILTENLNTRIEMARKEHALSVKPIVFSGVEIESPKMQVDVGLNDNENVKRFLKREKEIEDESMDDMLGDYKPMTEQLGDKIDGVGKKIKNFFLKIFFTKVEKPKEEVSDGGKKEEKD